MARGIESNAQLEPSFNEPSGRADELLGPFDIPEIIENIWPT